MTIDKIGKINEVSPAGPTPTTSKVAPATGKDTVSISSSAQKQAEFAKALEIVQNSDPIREEKVEAAKRNLATYMKDSTVDSKVLDAITEKILQSMMR